MQVKIVSTRGGMDADTVLTLTAFHLRKIAVINNIGKPIMDIHRGCDEDIQKLARAGIVVEKVPDDQ